MLIEHPTKVHEQFADIKPGEMFYDEHNNLYLKTLEIENEGSSVNSVSVNFVPGYFAFFNENSPVVRVTKIKTTC